MMLEQLYPIVMGMGENCGKRPHLSTTRPLKKVTGESFRTSLFEYHILDSTMGPKCQSIS